MGQISGGTELERGSVSKRPNNASGQRLCLCTLLSLYSYYTLVVDSVGTLVSSLALLLVITFLRWVFNLGNSSDLIRDFTITQSCRSGSDPRKR